MEREEYLKKHEAIELERLNQVFEKLDDDKKKANKGLIEQCARNKAMCDWLWDDIQENGTFEMFQQSDKVPPYEKERASAKHYATYSKLYSSVVKQLVDLLPKEEQENAKKGIDLEAMLG